MRKTTNWSLNDLVRLGSDDLLKKGQAPSFEGALKKATAAILFVIKDEFVTQLPKAVTFDNNKFSIAIMEDNDTVIVSYEDHVFEVNQRPGMGPVERGFIGFTLIGSGDERRQQYVDKLNRIREKANRIVRDMKENRAEFNKHAGIKDKEFLN